MTEQSDKPRSIEELKLEYEELNKRKIQAQTQLEEANRQLEHVQAEAKEEFGTSDIDELKQKLEEMEAENEKRRAEYQALLDKISGELKAVENETQTRSTAGVDDVRQ